MNASFRIIDSSFTIKFVVFRTMIQDLEDHDLKFIAMKTSKSRV
jgi:hypothetical protein